MIKVHAQTEVKTNALFLPIGIVNIAVEKAIHPKISLQAEAFVSPWKSFDGTYLQIYMGTLEGRYYFNTVMRGWFVGTYGSIGAFNLQKWNYWKKVTILDPNGEVEMSADGSPRITELYEKGFAFMIGLSGGYHFRINDKLGLDVYAGVGSVQSIYKGYYKDNEERYDKAEKWNKSGEFIPTRGGVMLTYVLN